MTRALILLAIAATIVLPGCSQGDQAPDWWAAWRDHEEHQQINGALIDAVNEPGGGDFARAVKIVRASNWPAEKKSYEVGMLVMQSFVYPDARRPAETLQQGLAMVERTAVQPGELREVAEQQLRIIFERGWGASSGGVPIDLPVSACWHKLETGQPGDPAQCVALRRQRLPQLSV